MSVLKKDQVFPIKTTAISDAELALIVAEALRQDFGDTPSAIKQIGRLTNANLRAIKNWYQARNTPSSGHLLLLARSSPSILEFVLKQVGGDDLSDAFHLLKAGSNDDIHSSKPLENEGIHTGNFVSINVTIEPSIAVQLNERQLWFVGRLQQNQMVKAENIASAWKINPRTAWRDVGALVDMNLIRFVGARKTGYYSLIKAN